MTTFFGGSISFQTSPAIILSGQTTSDAINLQGLGVVGLVLPAELTSTTMTFTGSQNNSNFLPLYNTAGEQLSVMVGTSRIVLLTPGDLSGVTYVKLVGGSSEAADRTIQVIARSM